MVTTMTSRSEYKVGPQVEAWIQALRDTGRKEGTLRCYKNNISRCFMYLELVGRSTKAEDITPDDIQYLWKVLPVKETVKHAYLRSLSLFTLHYTGRDVMKQANILRNREVRDRVFIEKADFRRMWKVAGPNERLILCFGAMMGLRREEISNIRNSDIIGNTLTIHGKGHGSGGLVVNVFIPNLVLQEIERYRKYKSQFESIDDNLLQSFDHRHRLKAMDKSRVGDSITKLGQKVGVRATTHSLRRLYATILFYDTNTDPQTVRNLMRHANLATTFKCYIEPSDSRARVAVDDLMRVMESLIDPKDDNKD